MRKKTAIVVALQKMGFSNHMVELFDTPTMLKTYDGRDSGLKGDIRVKGAGWRNENHVGGYKNDLGFEKEKNGNYTIHADGQSASWVKSLNQQYSRAVILEEMSNSEFFVTEDVEENQELHLTFENPYV